MLRGGGEVVAGRGVMGWWWWRCVLVWRVGGGVANRIMGTTKGPVCDSLQQVRVFCKLVYLTLFCQCGSPGYDLYTLYGVGVKNKTN